MSEWLACPKCKSENDMDVDMLERDFDEAYCDVRCKCGFSWREVFSFSHNETVEDVGRLLDDNGNVVDAEHDEEMLKEQLKEMRPDCVGGGLYD